jgi:hypothetical protein
MRLAFAKLRRLLLLSAAWLLLGQPASALTLVLLTNNNGSLTAEETARRTRFQTWGYTVTTLWDGAPQATYDAAMSAAHVVFVPEESSAADVAYKLRNATIGVVVEDLELDAEMGMASSDSTSSSQTNMTITDPAYGAGSVAIFSSAQPATVMQGTFAVGLHTVGVNGSSQKMLALMDPGTPLANTYGGNSVAAGRRLRLPWGGDAFVFSALNATGLQVLQLGVAWAAGDPLLLHLKFDDAAGTTAVDSSAYTRHGTYMGAPALGGAGVRSQSVKFSESGTSDLLNLSDTILDGLRNVSTTFWIRSSHTGAQAVVGGSRVSGDNRFLVHFASATSLQLHYNGVSRSFAIPSIADGSWHHVAVVTDATANQTTIYVDNAVAGTQAFSPGATTIQVDPGGMVIGQEQDCLGGCFDVNQRLRGDLDDLRIYARVLTAKEIADLYGLLGHWNFDEMMGTAIADASLKTNHAAFSSGSPAWVSGVRAGSLYFDGVSAAAETGETFSPPATGTVAFWFRSEGPPAARQRLFGLGGNWEVWQDPDGLLRFDLATDGFIGGFETASAVATTGTWYHVAAIYDADDDSYSVYINGALEKSGISSNAITAQAASKLTFATRTGLTADRFKGALDDFRIYNRKLTPGEINQLYGLVGWYKLDEVGGTVAADSSGLGNNGTFVGGPTLGSVSNGNASLNTAVDFTGTNYVQIPGLYDRSASVSVMAWAKLDTTDVSGAEVFSMGDHFTLRLLNGSPGLRGIYYNGSTWPNVSVSEPIGGGWRHYAAVYESGGTLKLYVDGVEAGSVAVTTPISYPGLGANSRIGAHGNGNGNFDFDGRIDEVKVFNRAVTAGELLKLYQGSRVPGIRLIRWVETR